MEYYRENKLEFKQIVLEHLKKILELSSEELRDKTSIVHQGNFSFTETKEDTRKSFVQAVEMFSRILQPYFDERAEKVYSECVEDIESFGFQLIKKYKEEYEELCNEMGEQGTKENFKTYKQVQSAKKLFSELNLLLKRNDYLSSSVYNEGDLEDIK
jgi:uncharacterized protein YaaR (DUF327 family)